MDAEQSQLLHLGLPADEGGYLREECPTCMLEFKSKLDSSERQDELTWWFHKRDIVLPKHPAESSAPRRRTCPYCGFESLAQDFIHSEHQRYIWHVVKRELVMPKLAELLASFATSANRGRGKGFSLEVSVSKAPRAPSPLAGPEPNDMVRVLCCGCDHRFKVATSWRERVQCPGCSAVVILT